MTILLDNAMKFTPAGGAVWVQVSREQEHFLQIEVADTGCGISAEASERIFEHLYQVSDDPGRAGRRGLGLGLHIAKELVLRQGGRIWVNSELGKGSRFFFTLPVFSLEGLIGPIYPDEGLDVPLAVISVEVSARDGAPDVPREILDATRAVLQESLRLEKDVLLPNLGPGQRHEMFFLVSHTHETGAASMGRRMVAALHRHKELQPADYSFAVAHSYPPPVARTGFASRDAYLEAVAAGVRGHIHNLVLEGKVV
jgi:hypothetical protein